MRLARVRATAYPKLTLSLRVLGRATRRLPRPRVARGLARAAPRRARGLRGARARRRAGGGRRASRWARTSRPITRNLAFIAAEKLMVRAGTVGARRAPRAPQAHPGRRRARRRLGRRRGRAARGAPAARRRRRRRRRARARGRGRFRRAVLRAGRRGVDARPRRDHRAGRRARPGWRSSWPSRRSGSSTPDVYQAWDQLGGPRSDAAWCPRPDGSRRSIAGAGNDLEPAAEALEPRLVEFRTALEAATGAPALLAGSGSAYVVPVADARELPAAGRRRSSRRLRVPVVGTTSVSRGVRLAS